MSKSKLFIFGLVVLVILLLASFVFAQIELKGPPKEYEKTPLEIRYPRIAGLELAETPVLPEYIRYIYYFSIIIAGLVAFVSLVYGGFRYLISVGNPALMADAREQMTAGIIGLLILLGSYLLLTTINPQLTILKLAKPPSPELEIPEVKPWEVKAEEITFYEIPIGQAIERVLEPKRLEAIANLSEDIRKTSEDLKNISQDYRTKIEECNKCSNTSPSPSSCNPDNTCPDNLSCIGDPCKDRAGAIKAKENLKKKAEEMTPLVNSTLLYLVPLQQDNKLLQFASYVLLETLVPLSYSQYLEFKQITTSVGGIVKRAPFVFEGVRLLPAGDFATFYTAEEQIEEIFAGMGTVSYIPYRTTPTCDQCEIDLNATDIDIPESTKEKMISMYPEGKIKASCPDGLDCWDYVIRWAKDNGWNPILLLSIWGEESAFSKTAIALGCDAEGIREGTSPYTGEIVSQLKCFKQIAQNCSGQCQSGNTDFCAFMSCYSSGAPRCTLANNPKFWPNVFWFYNEILPTGDTPTGAEPQGNCSLQQEKLPPGMAGCPLQPGFGVECPWCCYVAAWGCHRGIDLSAPMGTPLYAIADGTIIAKYDGSAFGYGNYIDLDTGLGVFRYAHLQEAIIPPGSIKPGVLKGDLIGYADATGYTIPSGPEGSHLHLEYLPDGITPIPVECERVGIQCIEEAPGFIPVSEDLCR